MSFLFKMLGLAAGAAARYGRANPAPSVTVNVTWYAVEPHRVGAFRSAHPEAALGAALVIAMQRRGMHGHARQARAELGRMERRNPGCEIYAEVS